MVSDRGIPRSKVVAALAAAALLGLGYSGPACAFVDPLSVVGRAVTTTMDVRTKGEVKADTGIAASANKRLLENKKAEWSGVTILVFAQHVVLAGSVKSGEAKKLVEEIVGKDQRIRSLKNEIVVANNKEDGGDAVKDTAIDAKVNAALTAAKGVNSVNMRWHTVNGNVVLMGIALSQAEADLTVAKAKSVNGVKSVKSHLRVIPERKK